MLDRGRRALTAVSGIIYAIYCERSRMLYVGQTSKTAMERFAQHARKARRGEGDSLHRAMRCHGWDRYRVFCLEKIPKRLYTDTKSFSQVATPRERFWIDRLHTYKPLGFNVEFARRSSRRLRIRKNNPMKWRKRKDDLIRMDGRGSAPSGDAARQPCPDSMKNISVNPDLRYRWYGSRDWLRRCEYLARRHKAGTLDTVQWERYALRSLQRMLGFLKSVDDSPNIDSKSRSAVLKALRARVLLRPVPAAKKKNSKMFIRICWTTNRLQRVGLKGILLKPEIKTLLPDTIAPLWSDETLMVAKRLALPVRHDVVIIRSQLGGLSSSGKVPHALADASTLRISAPLGVVFSQGT